MSPPRMAILSCCIYAAFGMQDEHVGLIFQEGDIVIVNGLPFTELKPLGIVETHRDSGHSYYDYVEKRMARVRFRLEEHVFTADFPESELTLLKEKDQCVELPMLGNCTVRSIPAFEEYKESTKFDAPEWDGKHLIRPIKNWCPEISVSTCDGHTKSLSTDSLRVVVKESADVCNATITSVNMCCLKDFVFQSSVSKSHIGIVEKLEFVEKGSVEAHVRWERCEIPQIPKEFNTSVDGQIASMKKLVQPLVKARLASKAARDNTRYLERNLNALRKQLEIYTWRRNNLNPADYDSRHSKVTEQEGKIKEAERELENAKKREPITAATFSELEKKVESSGAFDLLKQLMLRIEDLPTTKYIQETKPHPLGDICKLTKAHTLQMTGRTKTERLVELWTNTIEHLKTDINPEYSSKYSSGGVYRSKGVLRSEYSQIYEGKEGRLEKTVTEASLFPGFKDNQHITVQFEGLTDKENEIQDVYSGPHFYEKAERVWGRDSYGDTWKTEILDTDSYKCLADLQVLNDLETES